MQPASVPPDLRPLTEPVDTHDVRAFTRAQRTVGAGGVRRNVVVILMFLVFGVVFVTVAAGVVSSVASAMAAGRGLSAFTVLPVIVIALALVTLVGAVISGARRNGERRYRLHRFAAANGLDYRQTHAAPTLPGMIFSLGSSRTAHDVVRGYAPRFGGRFVEFANYRYTTGSGKNRTTHRWGYIAVHLRHPLPHIVLDALGNNGLFGASNLPAAFRRDQRLSLEGDFDRYFALFCPVGYERDALYLFTPDIMARFVDNAAALDVEIVDDWLFFYARQDFSTLQPARWAWLFSVVEAMLDKLGQWERWRDDRLAAAAASPSIAGADAGAAAATTGAGDPGAAPIPMLRPPPGVAAPGRRLRRGVPWAAIILGAVFVVFWFLMNGGLSLFVR